MNVYIGKPVVISDMQGPCDSGFHVPTNTEFGNLITAGITLGAWTDSGLTNIKNYLKIPLAGRRSSQAAEIGSVTVQGYYRCCNAMNSYGHIYYYILMDNYYTESGAHGADGYSIRPFKDTPVVPTSSWTTLYQGTGTAGIYYNSTDGLISISSDGTNWITIADKNCGATTVYNSGDTLSEANCGKYYQWGNNYGFPFTGSVTTSSTLVDASTYGPGNYYSSSTFITNSSSPYNWDSSNNANLWGGVTQGTTTDNRELKNAYIGEYGWKPGENTVAYYPLKEDTNDHSGNGITLTNTQYLSKQSSGYSWVASQGVSGTYIELGFTNQDAKFISMWLKVNSSSGNTDVGTLYKYGMSGYSPSHYDDSSISNKFYLFTNSSCSVGATSNGLTFNEWHHITIGYDGSKIVISKDGVQETLYNGSGYNFGNQVVLCGIGNRGNANYTLSDCIVETVARTAQEIQDYYNQTKYNYGL